MTEELEKKFSPNFIDKAKRFEYPDKPWDNLIYEFRLLRISRGITASRLDEISGTKKGGVSRFENGYNVTVSILTQWANQLGANVSLFNPTKVELSDHKDEVESIKRQRDLYASKLEAARQNTLEVFKDLAWDDDVKKYWHQNKPGLMKMQSFLIKNNYIKEVECLTK